MNARPLPPPLPIDALLPQLLDTLRQRTCAVLGAPPGAGKTTRVPPALLKAGLAGDRKILMLEPRRVAARAAARRMAEEQGWRLGGEVGYQVRFDRQAGKDTRILVVTEGILVRLLQDDPFLEEIGVVLFDEFHERSLYTDLSLAMARRVQAEVRADLRLLVMSATLDAGPIAGYLGDAPILSATGRSYPVEVRYLDEPDTRPIPQAMAAAVRRVFPGTQGDLLCFLPGVGEIRRTQDELESWAKDQDTLLVPLYGDLPPEQQDAALRPGIRRRVVLATNVAETSITIEGVTQVLDSGLARVLRHDPGCGLDRLELGRSSRSSADQRAGRAGRLGPGRCLRLWTEAEQRTLRPQEDPEIRRVDLAGTALELLCWGEKDLNRFGWFDPPEPSAIDRALDLLRRLGALENLSVTGLGRRMVQLPVHPRLSRLLLEGHALGQPEAAALTAALLSDRDPFRRSGTAASTDSDVLDRVEAVESGRLDRGAARSILRARDQLLHLIQRELGKARLGPPLPEALGKSLLAAFPDRLARRRESGSRRGLRVGGRGVRLAEESGVLRPDLFLCIELDAGRRGEYAEALVRQASGIERAWLPAASLRDSIDLRFDPQSQRVIAFQRKSYEDLVLEEKEVPIPDPAAAAEVLAEAAARDLQRALPLEDVEPLLARLQCLAQWLPELELPASDQSAVRALLPLLCSGRRSFADLRKAPLRDSLLGSLSFRQREALAHEAPERLEVPSGSRIALQYQPGHPPVLAARIQELFGLAETPRVARGRVPVLLHLLAPNGRPQQVTDDLHSFWDTIYPEVRKELRGRYPKHSWPEDPWNAPPERRPRRKQP